MHKSWRELSLSRIQPWKDSKVDVRKQMKHSREVNFRIVQQIDDQMTVQDPWGTEFRLLVVVDEYSRDKRGTQPGSDKTEGLGMCDLSIYTPEDCNMAGIVRFYQQVLGAPTVSTDREESRCLNRH